MSRARDGDGQPSSPPRTQSDDANAAATPTGEQLRRIRLDKIARLKELGVAPYPVKTPAHEPIATLRTRFAVEYEELERAYVSAAQGYRERKRALAQWEKQSKAGEDVGEQRPPEPGEAPQEPERPTVAVAGRIRQLRDAGKAKFIDIVDQTGRIQIMAGKKQVGEATWNVLELCDLGDILWFQGALGLTMTGELTIFAGEEGARLLSKSVLPPPNIEEKTGGKSVADPEMRQRQRYLDLMMNPASRKRFETRSKIVRGIRAYLDAEDFLEVETPMMQPLFGGAKARPFVTYHNTLDMQLYLRIAPELYLKRLTVGGMQKVYEINRNFRNEGISTQHNPEFTMLELYEAFADYERMMEITEGVVAAALDAAGLGQVVSYQGERLDFSRPWPRYRYLDLFNEHVGVEWGDRPALEAKAKSYHLDEKVLTLPDDWLAVELWEHASEAKLVQPCFVIDFPTAVSPLAKQREDDPRWVERFEAYVFGMEVANAFSELNDPVEQHRRFAEQVEEAEKTGDEEIPREIDDDYVEALSYGMPPAGGLGIGIDRLVMLLTNSASIRDVILFPQLRRQEQGL